MQRYGRLFTGFWTSPDIVGQPVETKLLGAHLLSSPHGNMIGCFRVPVAYVVEDLRMGSETVSKGFRNLSEKGFLTYDSGLSWVLIRKFLKWNPIENPNQGKAAAKLFEQVPQNSSVYAPLVQMLKENPANFPSDLLNRLETLPEPFLNPHPHPQPQPQLEPTTNVELASESRRDFYSEVIDQVFVFYCKTLNRNPRQYALTPKRKSKAILRLKEREKATGSLELAQADLEAAISNVAADEFLTSGGYTGWEEQIFKSREEFEKRLNWISPTHIHTLKSNGFNGASAKLTTGSKAAAFAASKPNVEIGI